MSLFKKIIVLVPANFDGYKAEKGVLNMDCYPNFIKGHLKCYNLGGRKNLSMGIMINGQIYKFDLNGSNLKDYAFDIPTHLSSDSKVSCAVVDLSKSNYEAVLWGSTENSSSWQNMMRNLFDEEMEDFETNTVEVKNANPKLKRNANSYDFKQKFTEQNDLEQQIEDSKEDEKLENFIDSVVKATEPSLTENPFRQADEKQVSTHFYDKVKRQVETLLSNNETDEVLQEIIPASKFCKVNFEDDSGYYVFGVIYEDDTPRYLCYGIPSTHDEKPPKDMDGLYQWLPLSADEINGDGYWLMYQSAEDGKNIAVEII